LSAPGKRVPKDDGGWLAVSGGRPLLWMQPAWTVTVTPGQTDANGWQVRAAATAL
jgi:hypothetical protein